MRWRFLETLFFVIFAVLLTIPAHAGSVVWENLGLTSNTSYASGSTATSGGVTMTTTWSTVTDGGTFNKGSFADFVTYNQGTTGNHSGLLLMSFYNADKDPDDKITVEFTFSNAVSNLAFTLLDIDDHSLDDTDDFIEVYYHTGDNNWINLTTQTSYWSAGSEIARDNESFGEGWESDFNSRLSDTETTGNLAIDFNSLAVKAIRIKYFVGDDQLSGPDVTSYVGISDITYDDYVPSNPLEVTSTADTNAAGTLRYAMTYANANAVSDNITFNIPGTGPHKILVSSALPFITDDNVTIDATTQSGASCGDLWNGTPADLMIELEASASYDTLLTLNAANLTVKGLSITKAGTNAIRVGASATNAVVQCNYIGVNPDGTADGSGWIGILNHGGNSLIGGLNAGEGNLISGNEYGIVTLDYGGNTMTGTMIRGNFVGTNETGTGAIANRRHAIAHTSGNGTWSDISKNLISGNTQDGISVVAGTISGSAGDAQIAGNYIGVNRLGTAALANGGDGISFDGGTVTAATIGGTATSDRNVISGNSNSGIWMNGASNIDVFGNYIGLNAAGTAAIANAQTGVGSVGVSALNIGNGLSTGRNVIAGNGARAIQPRGTFSNLTIAGNYIGTDVTGNTALTNGQNVGSTLKDAMSIDGGSVATTVSITDNVIGGYSAGLIEFWGATATGVTIKGNNLGVGADGTSDITATSIEPAIYLGGGTMAWSNFAIGGTGAGEGNHIAYGGADGIEVSTTGTGIQIVGNNIHDITGDGVELLAGSDISLRQNTIYNSSGLGIDLGTDGVTANDSGDGDGGVNGLLNYPVLNSIAAAGTTVYYDLNLDTPSAANGYRIEFFKVGTADGSGHGEALTYVGYADVAGPGSNTNFTGSFTSTITLSNGDLITGTTTLKTGASSYSATSEFALNASATANPLEVTSTADSGGGTLRAAIDYANSNPGADTITFNISGAGPHKITTTSSLPTITGADTTIDGTTQTGATCGDLWSGTAPTLKIELESSTEGANYGITTTAANTTVKGLSITNYQLGVLASTGSNGTTVQCSYLGLNPDGTADGNSVGVSTVGANLLVGGTTVGEGNVISSNIYGILSSDGATGTMIRGNFIGTDPTGGNASANTNGINNYTGTATYADITDNLISGNSSYGIVFDADDTISGSSGDMLIQGNYIGLNRAGTGSISNGTGMAFLGSGQTGITIGGTTTAARNIIGGNSNQGIYLNSASDIDIFGNYLGLTADGLTEVTNWQHGIWLYNASSINVGNGASSGRNVIGSSANRAITIESNGTNISINGNYIGTDNTGNTPLTNAPFTGLGQRDAVGMYGTMNSISILNNVIGGFDEAAIESWGSSGSSVTVQGNSLNVGADGTSDISTGTTSVDNTDYSSVLMFGGSNSISGLVLGGTGAGEGNIIANGPNVGAYIDNSGTTTFSGNTVTANTSVGVRVSAGSTSVSILQNSIHTNGGIGIDLGTDGVTANDAGDTDTGANNLLNYPVINTLSVNGTSVLYDLNLYAPSAANGYRLEFFKTGSPDSSGYGEGQTYIGYVDVTGPGTNTNYTGTFTPETTVATGDVVTVTTTLKTGASSWGATSEFGLNNTVIEPLVVTSTADTSTVGTLRYAITYANLHAVADNITFNIPGSGVQSIAPATNLPQITDDGVTIDASTQPGATCGTLVAGTQHTLLVELNGVDGNNGYGFNIGGDNITIRGFSIGDAGSHAINTNGAFTGLRVECNYLSVHADGSTAWPTSKYSTSTSALRLFSGADDAVITNNVISGNTDDADDEGIRINDSNNITITGNIIGLAADGITALGNAEHGIAVQGTSSGIVIGGVGATDKNIISSNLEAGISFNGTQDSIVRGNIIGMDITASLDRGNGNQGVKIDSNGVDDISVLENLIAFNANQEIALDTNGHDVNDAGDGDTGPNDRMNYPVLNSFVADGSTTVSYDINLDVPTNADGYRIEFFTTIDPGELYGGSGVFLGYINVTGPGSNTNFTGSFSALAAVTAGDGITATATEIVGASFGSTSEFSVNIVSTTGADPLVVTSTADTNTIGTLRYAINYANANTESDDITFNIPTTDSGYANGFWTITLASQLPKLTDDGIVLDGTSQTGASCGDLWSGTPHTIKIEIDVNGMAADVMVMNGNSQIIQGVALVGATNVQSGVYIPQTKAGNQVRCSYLGLGADGAADGNIYGIADRGTNTIIGGPNSSDGNVISGNGRDGILTFSDSNGAMIEGNFIGTNPTGLSAIANGYSGVSNDSYSGTMAWSEVRHNLISGNTQSGINLTNLNPVSAGTVAGNHIGVDRTGLTALPNQDDGIHFSDSSASGIIIGGTTTADRNIISGNTGRGVYFGSVSNIAVQGNYIGLNAAGAASIPNNDIGVFVDGANSVSIGDGTSAGRNVIAANKLQEIRTERGVSGFSVNDNYIGTDATGNVPLLNTTGLEAQDDGIVVLGGTNGAFDISNNVIGGVRTEAIAFAWNAVLASGSTIKGNSIGIGADGVSDIDSTTSAEAAILLITVEAAGLQIGGSGPGEGNLIDGGTGAGILVKSSIGSVVGSIDSNIIRNTGSQGIALDSYSSFTISANSIYGNSGLGIDLGTNGVTANDSGDADTGANGLLNFPVLNTIQGDGSTTVNYDINYDAPTNGDGYRIEFFKNTSADASGYGEGQTYLGYVNITGPGSNTNYTGSFTASTTVSSGDIVSATATVMSGSGFGATSEFALNATSIGSLVVVNTNDSGVGSLRAAITAANASASDDDITFSIPTSDSGYANGYWTIALATMLPGVSDNDVSIDGTTQTGASCGQLTTGTPHTLKIFLDGTALSSSILEITGTGVSLKGLALGNATGKGFYAKTGSDNFTIDCSYLGVEPDGETAAPLITDNALSGANQVDSASATITNSLFSGSNDDASDNGLIFKSAGGTIQGSVFGLNASGTTALPNSNGVIVHNAANMVIGGTTAATRNVFSGNSNAGIRIVDSSNASIVGNYIGTDYTGSSAVPNVTAGILLESAYTVTTSAIGGTAAGEGNVISGNTGAGISLLGTATTLDIQGNIIGLNASGSAALANGSYGIYSTNASTTGLTIGGTTSAARNVISGNGSIGVYLSNMSGADILGNYIGTDTGGTSDLGNGSHGILLRSVSDANIGDGNSGGGNVVSGNTANGIKIDGVSDNIQVFGNYVGTNATGTAAVGNAAAAIFVPDSTVTNLVIGGLTSDQRNIVSGNAGIAIQIDSTTGTQVVGNYIGVGADGSTDLGNGSAGVVGTNAVSMMVSDNIIAYNDNDGVEVQGAAAVVSVLRNSIYSNLEQAIEIDTDGNEEGVNANDAGDADTGANGLLNFPVLYGVYGDGTTSVRYEMDLDAPANTEGYRIEFFRTSVVNSSGYGDAETYIGYIETGSHAGGSVDYSGTFTADVSVSPGDIISATTTSKTGVSTFGGTSEMALNGVSVAPYDFSDSPQTGTSYGTARHDLAYGVYLGSGVTGELSAYDSSDASADSDDGASMPSFTQSSDKTITVTVSGSGGYLQAWIDWNGDGDFADTGEQIANDVQDGGTGDGDGSANGSIDLDLSVPSDATTSQTFARFRWSTTSSLDATTNASNGEVEDYAILITGGAILTATRSTSVYDPSSAGLYAIPGNDVIVTISATNIGDGTSDTDSIQFIDEVPSDLDFFNGVTASFGSSKIGWTETSTGLSFSDSTDVGYSSSGTRPTSFAQCTYTPTSGYDTNVTYVCFNPKGAMQAGNPDPTFSIQYRARIK